MTARPARISRGVFLWGAAGLLLSLGAQPLFELLWLRAGLVVVAWVAVGLFFVLRRLWDARRAEQRSEAFAGAGSVVAIGLGVALVSPLLAQAGASLVERLRFAENQAAYDRIVADAVANPTPGRHVAGEQVYLVDPGPPVRVAFPWPGASVGGWCGAVHDASGEVMRIEDEHADPAGLDAVRGVFGGILTDCHPLPAATYFLCCFTLDVDLPDAADLEDRGEN